MLGGVELVAKDPPRRQKQDGGDHAYLERRETEAFLHGLERAVNDARVVAEEQTAEGGDHGDEAEAAGMRARPIRWQRMRDGRPAWLSMTHQSAVLSIYRQRLLWELTLENTNPLQLHR